MAGGLVDQQADIFMEQVGVGLFGRLDTGLRGQGSVRSAGGPMAVAEPGRMDLPMRGSRAGHPSGRQRRA